MPPKITPELIRRYRGLTSTFDKRAMAQEYFEAALDDIEQLHTGMAGWLPQTEILYPVRSRTFRPSLADTWKFDRFLASSDDLSACHTAVGGYQDQIESADGVNAFYGGFYRGCRWMQVKQDHALEQIINDLRNREGRSAETVSALDKVFQLWQEWRAQEEQS